MGGVEEVDQFPRTEIKAMQMTSLNQEKAMEHCERVLAMTEEELQNEFDFLMAERLIDSMHKEGLLPDETYAELRRKNLEKFPTILGRIS